MTKRMVTDQYFEFEGSKLDGCSLKELRDEIQGWIDAYGEEAVFSCGACYESVEFTIISRREETDEEYAKRLQLEKQTRNRQEYHDRKEWERLKAKYGN